MKQSFRKMKGSGVIVSSQSAFLRVRSCMRSFEGRIHGATGTRGQRIETTQKADFSWSNHPANFQQRRRKLPIRYHMLALQFDQYLEVVDQGAKSWFQPQDGHLSHFDYVNNRRHKMHASNFHLVKHSFDIGHHGAAILSKSQKYSTEVVQQIGSSVQLFT